MNINTKRQVTRIFFINSPSLGRRRFAILILLASCCFLKAQTACAQTFLGAGPEALGGSGRAANSALDAHFLNPAALAFGREANIGLAFQEGHLNTDSPTNNYAFIVTENDPDKFTSGGFAYVNKRNSFPDHTYSDQDFSLDLAGKFLPTISWGVQGHRLFRQTTLGAGFTKYNITLGTLILPMPWLGFAFVTYDLLNDDDLDMVPVIALATHVIIMDLLRLRADVTQPQKKNPGKNGTLNLGMEIDASNGFLVRTGGLWDTVTNNTYFSAGLAWEGPRLSAAYAFKNNVNVTGDTTHTFQAWLNF